MAAELQDQVINAIFAVGLHLQSTAEIAADPLVRRRVEEALSDLDDLVCMIRDSVFRLHDRGQRAGVVRPSADRPGSAYRKAVLTAIERAARSAGTGW